MKSKAEPWTRYGIGGPLPDPNSVVSIARANQVVARRTAAAMVRIPATESELASAGIETWQVARAVWRAKRWLRSTRHACRPHSRRRCCFDTKVSARWSGVGIDVDRE